ncbi:MFS general substrate transporter, partial [Xylaria bambusicola]|uniref:MFS general substrate transporter n=1 Tax=Xylaria bambusicola TaxID=326684 RepID=UPI002007DB15
MEATNHDAPFSTQPQLPKSQNSFESATHIGKHANEAQTSQKVTSSESSVAYGQQNDAEKTSADTAPAISAKNKRETEECRSPALDNLENDDLVSRSTETANEATKYPSTWKASLLTVGLCLVTFATAVDNTIIATAIPSITEEFHSLNDIGWYASSYLLASTALQPSYGKVYTHFNIKWVYLAALVVFEVGSVVAATADSSIVLIIGRVIAGLGGGGLTSGGSTILTRVVPIDKRAVFNSAFASTFGIASVVGPLLGGVLTDNLSWRWCFYINLPLGAIAFITVLFVFRLPKRARSTLSVKERLQKLDILGASFLVPGVVSLLLALNWGGIDYPWSDSRVWGTLLGFGLITIVFVGTQLYRGEDATIPPRVFGRREVLTSVLFQAIFTMGLYAHFYYLPFYFQVVQGTSAMDSGIRTIPYVAGLSILAVVAGIAVRIIGYYAPPALLGSALFTAGAGLMYTLQVNTSQPRWIGYQVLAGGGAGAAFQMPLLAVQSSLSEKDVPVGNALVGFFLTLGSSIGVSIAQNIFSSSLRAALGAVTGIDPEAIIAAGAAGARGATPPARLAEVLEAYNKAVTTTFIYAVATGGLGFIVTLFWRWTSLRSKK